MADLMYQLAAGWLGVSATAVLVIVLIVALAEFVLIVKMMRSLRGLRLGAERFARGDLSRSIEVQGPGQLRVLADSLNRMASMMQRRYQTAIRQRNEFEAVLSSMVEGVCVVDLEGRFVSMNEAAGRLFGEDINIASGRMVEEIVRNPELQSFIGRSLRSEASLQDTFNLQISGDHGLVRRELEVQSAPLTDEQGERHGIVIVLHDVSELRRLEGVRSDFVANVSHEIKTPVTAIKGFCETLLDGGEHSPEDAERFLRIIGRQSERLHSLVDDILTLSRLEQGQTERIERSNTRVAAILHNAREACEYKAKENGIRIEVDCPPDLRCAMNAPLLEQAVVNLLDNAVKYSRAGGRVTLEAFAGKGNGDASGGDGVTIRVVDRGAGISSDHLPRLFERFYRPDKARSRELGGTGLGLAIVKHIAQAHGGQVSVESTLGEGSVFTIELPGVVAGDRAVAKSP